MAYNEKSDKIKLVHVVSDAISYTFFKGQIAYMQEKGIDVTFIATPSARLEEVAKEGIKTVGIPMLRTISPMQDIVSIWKMARFLYKLKPDIVHSHTPKGGLIGAIGAWLARVPVRIYHIRGFPFMTATGLKRFTLKTTERISCACAKYVLSVSHSIRQVAIEEKICAANKVAVLLNGSGNGVAAKTRFNPDLFSISDRSQKRETLKLPSEAIVLGFVGRMVGDKGIHELLETFKTLSSHYPNLYLLLIGQMEEGDAISPDQRGFIETHERVLYVGEQRDLPNWYTIMDIVVFPTYREGFPNVPLEAAAMQLPIVATDIPGCKDAVVHDETGLLVPVKNVEALTLAIESYLEQPIKRLKHGQNARERVLKYFDQPVLWQAYHQFYQDLLEKNNHAKTII